MLRGTFKRIGVAIGALALAMPLMASIGVAPASAAIAQQHHVDTGWRHYDGGCQARTELYYWPQSNTLQMKTDVHSPYLFAACRVNAKAFFDTAFAPITDGPSQQEMACGVLDPSCASTRYGGWQTFDPASSMLKQLDQFADLSQLLNGIRVEHTRA